MKTLYITDLDGTLLNSEGNLSDYSAYYLNKLIEEESVMFSVATARTYSTVVPMMKGVKLNCPVILMNGVCIYDTEKLKPVIIHRIEYSSAVSILEIFKKFGKYPMLYYDKDGNLTVEYIKITTLAQEKYVHSRKENYNKKMVQVNEFSLNPDSHLIYIAILDNKEELEPIYKSICDRRDITCNFYSDNYSGDYFLEIYSKYASKAKSALELKKILGAEKIVAFGDNLNDIPLFECADEAYAVKNAYCEVKQCATGVIDSNDKDAVVRFITERIKTTKGKVDTDEFIL